MKIINCWRVVYIIIANHIATIVYDYNNGQPSAHIYYDGQIGEIIEAENGQTMRLAMRTATWTLKSDRYWEARGWDHLQRWQAHMNGMNWKGL